MVFNSRTLILAAGILAAGSMAIPMVAAVAQQNNPAGNLGSNRSSTAAPGTADSKAASGMTTGDVSSSHTATSGSSGAALNSTTPGATGHTVVPGSNSSQAGSAVGTAEQKTGSTGGSSK